jgi:hypothetical protein
MNSNPRPILIDDIPAYDLSIKFVKGLLGFRNFIIENGSVLAARCRAAQHREIIYHGTAIDVAVEPSAGNESGLFIQNSTRAKPPTALI